MHHKIKWKFVLAWYLGLEIWVSVGTFVAKLFSRLRLKSSQHGFLQFAFPLCGSNLLLQTWKGCTAPVGPGLHRVFQMLMLLVIHAAGRQERQEEIQVMYSAGSRFCFLDKQILNPLGLSQGSRERNLWVDWWI
jgi:hypothetical protein